LDKLLHDNHSSSAKKKKNAQILVESKEESLLPFTSEKLIKRK
jgi:hypothetical protein